MDGADGVSVEEFIAKGASRATARVLKEEARTLDAFVRAGRLTKAAAYKHIETLAARLGAGEGASR